MRKEEILAMRPGSELNAKVAEKIMRLEIAKDKIFGYVEQLIDSENCSSVWSPVRPYSEDISVAELVVEKMVEMGHADAVHWADFGEGKYTEAEAICKAALLAVLEETTYEQAGDRILRQALGEEEK